MKILVACFSMTGKIGGIAPELAQKLNAQYVKIEPKSDSPVLKGLDAMRSYFRLKAAIKPCKTDLSDVDHLVVVSSAAASAASSYVMKYISLVTNSDGKQFSILTRESNANRSGGPVYTVGSAPGQIKRVLENKGMIYFDQAVIPGHVGDADAANPYLMDFSDKILSL